MYIYIYIPYIPYCQPFCLEPPEPETIHWKPGKNFFYLKLKKRWMSKWKIWRSKTGGIWEGHRASMSWGRGVEQCLPQEMHESPRSGDFYPFQRCMFDQFFQDVLLCMFWPTQLRQFQECGGWIRVKLHTRLYTGHSPPPHTHTQKKTPQQRRYQKITCFLLGGGQFASHELSCYLLLQEWLEKNAEEVKQVARAAYNRIPDKSLGLHRKGNGDPFPLFQ